MASNNPSQNTLSNLVFTDEQLSMRPANEIGDVAMARHRQANQTIGTILMKRAWRAHTSGISGMVCWLASGSLTCSV